MKKTLQEIYNDFADKITFKDDAAKKEFTKQIDESYVNGIIADKNQGYELEKKSLQDEIKVAVKSNKELQAQNDKLNSEIQTLNDKSTANQIIGGEMAKDDFEELMLLVNAKLAKDKTLNKNEVMKEIAQKRGFGVSNEPKKPAGEPLPAAKQTADTVMVNLAPSNSLGTAEDQFKAMKEGTAGFREMK